jgi:hypothetical protein
MNFYPLFAVAAGALVFAVLLYLWSQATVWSQVYPTGYQPNEPEPAGSPLTELEPTGNGDVGSIQTKSSGGLTVDSAAKNSEAFIPKDIPFRGWLVKGGASNLDEVLGAHAAKSTSLEEEFKYIGEKRANQIRTYIETSGVADRQEEPVAQK